MPYYLAPIGNDQQCDANGNPFVGGKIYTYLAGTSTSAATYTDATTGTSQSNPIILNSLGLPASPIWMAGGIPLKFIFKDSADVVIRTIDNVSGINDATTVSTLSEWVPSGSTPTYTSATTFSLVGDQTSTFQVNRRIKSTNSGGTIYSSITVSSFASNATAVTVVNDSGSLDSGMSAVSYALLSATNPSTSTAVTQAQTDSSTKIATTAFVASTLPLQFFPVTASVVGGALTVNLSNVSIDFINSTLTNGVTTRLSSGALAITVPSTATLGSVSGQSLRVGIAVANNAGTPVLCVVNGTVDESALYSPTTISTGATVAGTVYSASAVAASSPMRLVGYVDVPNVTAGTYASITQVRGYGGTLSPSSLGVGQTWQSVTRTVGTTYFNTTGKPIFSVGNVPESTDSAITGSLTVSGLVVSNFGYGRVGLGSNGQGVVSGIVPSGASYVYSGTVNAWFELR